MINTPVQKLTLLAITGIFLASTVGCVPQFGEREGAAQREEVEENEGVRRRGVIGREGSENSEEEDDEGRDSRNSKDNEDDDEGRDSRNRKDNDDD